MDSSEVLQVLIFGFAFAPAAAFLSRRLKISYRFGFTQYLMQLAASCTYFVYAKHNAADANGYFWLASKGQLEFGFGTKFIRWFTQIFPILGASKLITFLSFSLVGYVGLMLLCASMNACTGILSKRHHAIAIVLLLLPGPHFWTSMIGKDAIVFFALSLLLYSHILKKYLLVSSLLGLLLISLIRPHIAFMTVAAFLVASIWANTQGWWLKLLGVLTASLCLYFSIDLVADYVGIEGEVTSTSVSNYVEVRQQNLKANTAVELSDKNIIERAFLFLFTPLFDRRLSPLRLIISFENLSLILVFFYCLPKAFKVVARSRNVVVIFCIVFIVMGTIVLSASLTNQGLAIRQKMMLVPCAFIIAALSLWVREQQLRTK